MGDTAAVTAKEKKPKGPPSGIVIPPKKPKLSKAERRALQEEQRAAKGGGKPAAPTQKVPAAAASAAAPSSQEEKKDDAPSVATTRSKRMDKTLSLFSHLPQYRDPEQYEEEFTGVSLGSNAGSQTEQLHPEVLVLGVKYADGIIRGGNSRCKAMLRVFQRVIQDYETPENCRDLRNDLNQRVIKPTFQYWTTKCRPHSVSMGNAFSFLKLAIANLDREMDQEEVKEVLIDTIDAYMKERIDYAGQAIAKNASTKIADGDVILTFSKSDVIEVLLKDAATSGKKFRVICVDSRPLLEGQLLVERLAAHGLDCTYILLNALSYVMMREVTKVFLGAAALMSDGSVLSRVGTACVALLAQSNNVPVLFCCETYKISNRVQLESITYNELGNPDDVVSTNCAVDRSISTSNGGGGVSEPSDSTEETNSSSSVLADWRGSPDLKLVNLLYDLTPSEFVSGIVTEMGILPPTSVAVLLREMNPQENDTAFLYG